VPRGWVDIFAFLVFGWVAKTSKMVFGWVAVSQIWYLGGSLFYKFGIWVGHFLTDLVFGWVAFSVEIGVNIPGVATVLVVNDNV
jgi:hypothetical protein